MASVRLGKATHKHEDNSISELRVVGVSTPELGGWVSIQDNNDNFMAINSKEQWEKLKKIIDAQF